MWWFSRLPPHGNGFPGGKLSTVLVCLLPLALASCGFRPLYGKDSYNAGMMDELASVEVAPLADREGQLLRNALLTDLNPRGMAGKPHYRLVVTPSINETQQALRTDDTATRNQITYNITYWLYEDKTRVVSGSFSQSFSYDFLEEHYANVSAADDIHRRAAQSVADEIRNRLAAYFAKNAEMKAKSANK